MAAQKRSLDESGSTQKHKKSRVSSSHEATAAPVSQLIPNEIDFPRGGGTSFTPLEVKTIRAEASKEADQELFKAYTSISSFSSLLIVTRMPRNPKRPRRERENRKRGHL